MIIDHRSDLIEYTGRIDSTEEGSRWYFPSTKAEVHFKGTKISVKCVSLNFWGIISIGVIVDGRLSRVHLSDRTSGQECEYVLAENLAPEKEHTLILYKMQAANHAFELHSFECDGEFIPHRAQEGLKIEYYGDSVSAGECVEADSYIGLCDPCSHDAVYDNSYYSYTWQCARLLNARFHNISQGGLAVLDGTGYYHVPDYYGLTTVYDKVCYFPEGCTFRSGSAKFTEWDFSKYTPDIVVFALGQNDDHNGIDDGRIDINVPEIRSNWKESYKKVIREVSGKYSNKARIIMLTTVLMHDPSWDKAIDEICAELSDEGLPMNRCCFSRMGKATHGHPRRVEQAEMAGELAKFIDKLIKNR